MKLTSSLVFPLAKEDELFSPSRHCRRADGTILTSRMLGFSDCTQEGIRIINYSAVERESAIERLSDRPVVGLRVEVRIDLELTVQVTGWSLTSHRRESEVDRRRSAPASCATRSLA